MNIEDFTYIWRGKKLKNLSHKEASLLADVDVRGPQKKRALLLLHGFSSTPAVYREMLPILTSIYDGVVCQALPGHANSIAVFSRVQAHEWVRAVETTCSELIDSYEQVEVMGLSLGGVLACHLAGQFPLHHLYLLAPALFLRVNMPLMLKLAKLLRAININSIPNRAGNLYTRRFAEISYHKLPVSTIIEVLTFLRQFTFVPPQCPVDVFLGRFDEVVDSVKVGAYFSSMQQVAIHWLEHSAHVLPLDGDMDAIIACIKSYQQT